MINFAMDLTPLMADEKLEPTTYVQGFIQRFAEEVNTRLEKLS